MHNIIVGTVRSPTLYDISMQDCVSIVFSAQRQQIKFSVVCKLKDVSTLII